jgi:hypothetical protein
LLDINAKNALNFSLLLIVVSSRIIELEMQMKMLVEEGASNVEKMLGLVENKTLK